MIYNRLGLENRDEIVKLIGYPEIKLEKKIDFKDLFEKNQK